MDGVDLFTKKIVQLSEDYIYSSAQDYLDNKRVFGNNKIVSSYALQTHTSRHPRCKRGRVGGL